MPDISVIFPTRGRPDHLSHSIHSLLDNASDPDRVEVLLAVDPDEVLNSELPSNVRVWRTPTRYGYIGLHHYYNGLAERARGDWLFIWNDDAAMKTQGWDDVVMTQPEAMLWPWTGGDGYCNFFFIPSSWPQCTGHIGLHPLIDMWIDEVCNKLKGRIRHVPITTVHYKFQNDQTARDKSGGWLQEYHTPEMQAAREEDARKLEEKLGGPGNLRMVTVILPGSVSNIIPTLLKNAAVPTEVEFLVAAGGAEQWIRDELSEAGVMGYCQVHGIRQGGPLDIVPWAHGNWIRQWGFFSCEPGWDEEIRGG